jgi:hypothetical protein
VLFKSTDSGGSWRPIYRAASSLASWALDPLRSRLYVGTDFNGQVDRSDDGGATWTTVRGPSPKCTFTFITPAPSPPPAIYLTVDCFAHKQLDKSTDDGRTWSEVFGLSVPSIAPADTRVLYASPAAPPLPPGLYRSGDGGLTWSRVGEQQSGRVLVDPRSVNTLYRTSSGGVFKSFDGGASWASSSAGLALATIDDLVIDPMTPSTVYAAGEGGIFRSQDAGSTWSGVTGDLPGSQVDGITLDPLSPAIVYASVPGEGLFRTEFSSGSCAPSPAVLCLGGGRFDVRVSWRSTDGLIQAGTASSITGSTGAFWFFSPDNLELVVKVLDGRAVNGKWWVFYGALSNVEYTITVTDTLTGAVKTYFNPQGQLASVADTSAF